MKFARDIILNSGIKFGTSGARGLVADFTAEVNAAFTVSFLTSGNFNKIAIGIDNRPSSPLIANDCINAAKSLGIAVDYYGVLPTPALAYQAMQDGIACIMVTGSHIPFDRNGIKFYRPDGEITKLDEQLILNSSAEVKVVDNAEGLLEVNTRAIENYIERYVSIYPDAPLKGKRIGIYQHSSAGRDVYPKLFSALGAEVVNLGRSDTFVPIDTEAVADADIEQAKAWQQEFALDAVFSTDGDGDRPLLSDETGEYLRGDVLCLLAAQSLAIDALAVPVSCNSAIEASGYFKDIKRTKIGSPYVIEAFADLMKQYKSVAGFEANGGFLLASDLTVNDKQLNALPTRDAVLPVLAVLANKLDIKQQVNMLPQIYTASDRIQNFAREASIDLIAKVKDDPSYLLASIGLNAIEVIEANEVDGYRMTLVSGEVVHLRPSGNAPELRCYSEAESATKAKALVDTVLDSIKKL